MDHHSIRVRGAVGALLIGALFLLASCGDGVITGGNSGGNTTSIRVGNNFFNPTTSTVPNGSTVTWTWNSGSVLHNVTFADGPFSPNQDAGTYQRTFTVSGTYNYLCTLHGGMSGTIVIE